MDYADIGLVEGLWISLAGLGIVLVLLIMLIGLFALLSSCVKLFLADKQDILNSCPPSNDKAQVVGEAPGSCGKIKLFNVTDRDAALIMAIVAHKMEEPLNTLRFISIKEVTEV